MPQEQHSENKPLTVKDLNTESPRWCVGCGDFGILMSVKRFMVDRQLQPHETVNISGIGCSGRAPHYFNTYGLHGIHGRAIPIALGLALTRPDLKLFVHSGDGDALSIGGNHLIHGIHKNFNCVFILYDNEIYALTKRQTSPTTVQGLKTNTQPFGSYLTRLNPVRLVLGAGASFVASTADWMPDHMASTLKAAYAHKGFSFIHVSQRCPHFHPNNFNHKEAAWFSFLNSPEDGIAPDKKAADKTEVVEHNPRDLEKAFQYANSSRTYFGLFYYNPEKIRYDELLRRQTEETRPLDRSGFFDGYRL